MKSTDNTILITGGGSGIGLETAKCFSARGNRIIIAGRDAHKLNNALQFLPGATAITADVTNEKDIDQLVTRISEEFPQLNVVMNNAGKAHLYSLVHQSGAFDKALDEMLTNFLSVVRLTEKLLPVLKQQDEAAIINNSSVAAFIPSSRLPSYSATKAALHSYTQSLRFGLASATPVKVFEVLPPLVDTDFARAIPGEKIAAAEVAEAIVKGFENDDYEIYPGPAASLHALQHSSPEEAFKLLNRAN